ncbi:ATP-binding protein [Streptomyces sp. NPDC059008]|uniref:ATP-binding protein n=1 Tax=Streptomyces sp. NPDC059008 TaxID=3346693 RepID=UPI003676B112
MTTTARPAATGHPVYSETYPSVAGTAAVARRLVRDALGTWHLDHLADAGELIASELVANAVCHAGGRSIRLAVSRPSARLVRIAVVDRSPARLPSMHVPEYGAEHGRGLLLVDAFADQWGCDVLGSHALRGPYAKRVWAEMRVGA